MEAVVKRTRLGAVLWDMDGTLVDTEPYWHEAELDLVDRFGGTWTLEDQASVTGFDLRDAAAVLRDRGGVDLDVDEIVRQMLDIVIAKVRVQIPWRPGARELLSDLRESAIPCALVTMSWRNLVDAVTEGLPDGSFKITIAGDEVENGKPHPEPYLTAAQAIGVEPAECVALEDSPTGLASATAAGCVTVAVPNTVAIAQSDDYTSLETLVGVSASDLAGFIDRRSGRASRDKVVSRSRTRRLVMLAVAAAVIATGVTVAVLRPTSKQVVPPEATIQFEGWAPSFVPTSADSLAAYGGMLREVMPFWYTLQGDLAVTQNPDLTPDEMTATLAAARQHHLRVIPSILDKTAPGVLATALSDPVHRTANVTDLVTLVTSNSYDGLDLDYEQFGFQDPKSTWATTRANFVTFVGQLSTALHALGKVLTIDLPYIYDDGQTDSSGYWVYDYRALAPLVDRIHVMAYDYSTSQPGPIAPLSFVKGAIDGATKAVADRSKLDLAVPVYGTNWLVSTAGTCPADATLGNTGVSQRGIDDLVAKRSATPVRDAATGEVSFTYEAQFTDGTTTCTQTREVHYVDAQGTRERIDLARGAQLGGIAIWALGYDSPATWAAIGPFAAPPA